MNIALTRTDEEFPPHRAFTVGDLRRMIDAGIIREDERIELVEGEIVVMAAKKYAHELIKKELARAAFRGASGDIDVTVEPTIEFSQDILLEPDIAVFPRHRFKESEAGFGRLNRGDCLLVIEVAVSSLNYDKKTKARLYAALGVREFWVVDANERISWVHTGPRDDGSWSSIVEHGPEEILTTPALPGFSISLVDIQD
jgi:Uma2 family endonuclease